MNTLKKTVAVVLAVAMVLTMGIATSFAAYSDVPSTVNYAEAVNILSNLGIFNGYEDGTFRPNNTITRAEVATIIVRAKDLDEQKGATSFTDVPADHWAAGYINTAYANGIINGMGDGTFAPGADVTYEQVVKMIVAALGYEPKAAQKGGYPTGYLAIASEEGITSGAAGTVGQAATRATVAKLVYNALEVDMMDQVSWGTDTKYEKVEGKTLLSELDVEKIDAVVIDSYLTNYDGADTDKTVTLEAAKALTYDDEDYKKGETIGEFNEGGTAAASLLGYSVVAYVGVDDDTDEDTIFAISAKGAKNTVTTVKSDLLASEDDLSSSEQVKNEAGTVYYYKNSKSDSKLSSIKPDDKVTVYMNYSLHTTLDEESKGTDYYEEISADGGVVEFIDNDGNGNFDFVIISKYTAEGVVDSVEENDGIWVFEAKNGTVPEEFDEEDDDVLKLFVKGENYINVSEIAEGDTITIIGEEGTDNVIIYQVSSDKVEGKCSSVDTEALTAKIAGTDYSLSPIYSGTDAKSALNSVRSKEGTFYLNSDGLISYVDGNSAATGDYGYIVGAKSDTEYTKTTYSVKIVDVQGKATSYDLSSKVKVYGVGGANEGKSLDNDDVYEGYLADYESGNVKPEDRIVKFDTSNGKISKLTFVGNYDDVERYSYVEKEYDAEDKTIGASDALTDNTVVFVVGSDTDDNDEYVYDDEDNISVSNIGIFTDGSEYTVWTFVEDDDVLAVLAINPVASIDYSQNVFVVSGAEVFDDDDDDTYVTFTGLQGGKTTSFTMSEDDCDSDILAGGSVVLGKGSVLIVGNEVNGYVEEVEILVAVTKNGSYLESVEMVEDYTTKDSGNEILCGFDTIVDYDDGKVYFSDSYWTGDPDDSQEKSGYTARSNTQITVVDFTNTRLTSATVKNSTASSAFNLSSKYEGAAFFRIYDVDSNDGMGVLIDNRSYVKDVVVYKFNAGERDSYIGVTSTPDADEEEDVIPSEVVEVKEVVEDEVVEVVTDDDFDGVEFEF